MCVRLVRRHHVRGPQGCARSQRDQLRQLHGYRLRSRFQHHELEFCRHADFHNITDNDSVDGIGTTRGGRGRMESYALIAVHDMTLWAAGSKGVFRWGFGVGCPGMPLPRNAFVRHLYIYIILASGNQKALPSWRSRETRMGENTMMKLITCLFGTHAF